jgi:GntR family transcriptional regulator
MTAEPKPPGIDKPTTRLTTQPLHVQLRQALIKRIETGEWLHGGMLPNEIELAREFNLSPGTVRKALDWMEQARIVVRQQGRGTFVTDPSAAEFAARFDCIYAPDGTKLSLVPVGSAITTSEPTARERADLQLAAGGQVLRVRQTRRIKGGAVALVEEAVLPAALFAALGEMPEQGYDIVQASKFCKVLLGDGVEHVSIAEPPEHVAALFGISDARDVLVLDRTIYTIEGAPAERRRAWCRLGENFYRARLA